MIKNFFIDDFFKNENFDDKTYSIIGAELKRIRLRQSMTLSDVSSDICSVSYLCKIENAQLKPNRIMLRELCNKMNIDDEKINTIFQLKEIVRSSIKFYYLGKCKELKKLYDQVVEFNNYRSKLVELIYYVFLKDIEKTESICKELFKVASSMNREEQKVLIVFYSISAFYCERYAEVIDNIVKIASLNKEDYLGLISYQLLFECYFKLNNPYTLIFGNELKEYYLNNLYTEKADYVKYLLGLYKLSNDLVDEAIIDCKVIKNEEYRCSLKFFIDLHTGKCENNKNYKSLRPFARLLYTNVFEKNKYLEQYLAYKNTYTCDFSQSIAEYLSYDLLEEKYEQIVEKFIPKNRLTRNEHERKFFMNQLCNIAISNSKYKSFCQAYKALISNDSLLKYEV